MPGFNRLQRYEPARNVLAQQHHYLRMVEAGTLNGQAVARVMTRLKRAGFEPDVIVAHPGWGETLYAKDIFPHARLIHLCEWYYSDDGGATRDFDPEFPSTLDDQARTRTWNMLHALNLMQCDVAVSPTQWQRSRHPVLAQQKIVVQHEGISTTTLRPDLYARVAVPSGKVLRVGDPVVTYVARNLEPYRGFHVFMRALQRLQSAHPHVHALIVGGDGTSYGPPPRDAANWRERLLREVRIDPSRTHFLGRIAYRDYLRVLQISSAHIYLTYPFVLSWSALEAMACGALVIGSDTAPVREVIDHGVNGILVPFFDTEALVKATMSALEHPRDFEGVRERARASVQKFGLNEALAGYDALLGVSQPHSAATAFACGTSSSTTGPLPLYLSSAR